MKKTRAWMEDVTQLFGRKEVAALFDRWEQEARAEAALMAVLSSADR